MPTDPIRLQQYACVLELTEEQRKAIAQFASEECYYPGYTLSEEGKTGTYLYLITKGEIEVLYSIGEEVLTRVDQISSGEIIGCSALIEPYAYTSTTRSLTEIEVLMIDAEALRKLMNEDCPLGFSIQKEIIRILIDQLIDFRLGA
jgi:CRP-like cAMP-binding protein